MSQVKNHQSSEDTRLIMLKSSTQRILYRRKQFRVLICRQGMQRKKKTEQLRLGNGKVMELKLIKHDEAL